MTLEWGSVAYEIFYCQNPSAMDSDDYDPRDSFIHVGSGIAPIADSGLREIFKLFNFEDETPTLRPNRPESRLNRSMSVGDLIMLRYTNHQVRTYRVQKQGFRLIPNLIR